MNDLYIDTILNLIIDLKPKDIIKNFEEKILKNLQDLYEGKCIKEGYVVKNSIKIISRSNGHILRGQSTAGLRFNVKVHVKICKPVKGHIINVVIDKMNKGGFFAIHDPLHIFVAKDYHTNGEHVFKNLKIGDKIDVEVIGAIYKINSKHIDVICKIPEQLKKKGKISIPIISNQNLSSSRKITDKSVSISKNDGKNNTIDDTDDIDDIIDDEDKTNELIEKVDEEYAELEDETGAEPEPSQEEANIEEKNVEEEIETESEESDSEDDIGENIGGEEDLGQDDGGGDEVDEGGDDGEND